MEEKRKAQEARLPAEALEVARKAIDRQDQIILQAFQERMKAAGKIAEIKEEQGLPVYVPQREKEILEQVSQSVPAELAGYAERLFETLMELSREYQRKDRHYGLLGRTLGHSFSPEIHRMLGQWSEPYDYQIFQVEPEDLRAFLYSGCWNGLNVTIPYKREVMKYCDEISPEAERIGAVNTLVRRGGKYSDIIRIILVFASWQRKAASESTGKNAWFLDPAVHRKRWSRYWRIWGLLR